MGQPKNYYYIFLIFFATTVWAGTGVNPETSRVDLCSTVETEDQTVQNLGCLPLRVTNGDLTDNTTFFSLDTSGATSGDIVAVGDCASGSCFVTGGTASTTLHSTSGTMTLGGIDNTNNENLTLDFETTADTVIAGTGTGVTKIDFAAIGLELNQDVNLTLGAQTLDHDGTNFVFNDQVNATSFNASSTISGSVLDITSTDIEFAGFTSCTALETNSIGTLICGSDADSGGAPRWDQITNPTSGLSLTMGNNTTLFLSTLAEGNFWSLQNTADVSSGATFTVEQLDGNPTGGDLVQLFAADADMTVMRVGQDNPSNNQTVFSSTGAITQEGTATFTLQDGTDLIITANDNLGPFLSATQADTMAGVLTTDGLTMGVNENLTLGAQTLDHNGTDFVFNDSVNVTASSSTVSGTVIVAVSELDVGSDFITDITGEGLELVNNALSVKRLSRCAVIENLVAADDNISIGSFNAATTVEQVWCSFVGTGTTAAQISLEDGGGNAMTHTTPTCTAHGTQPTKQSVTAGGALVATEIVRFDVDNTPDPTTDDYTICYSYSID